MNRTHVYIMTVLFSCFSLAAYEARDLFCATITVTDSIYLKGKRIMDLEQNYVTDDVFKIPTSRAVFNHIDSIFVRTYHFTYVAAEDTVTIKAKSPTFYVPPEMDGFVLQKVYAAGVTNGGSCDVDVIIDGVVVSTLVGVDTSGYETDSLAITLNADEFLTFDVDNVSGFVEGLGLVITIIK